MDAVEVVYDERNQCSDWEYQISIGNNARFNKRVETDKVKYVWWYEDPERNISDTIMIGTEEEFSRPLYNRDWILIIADDYDGDREKLANWIVEDLNKREEI